MKKYVLSVVLFYRQTKQTERHTFYFYDYNMRKEIKFAGKVNFGQCIRCTRGLHHDGWELNTFFEAPLVGRGKVCPNEASLMKKQRQNACGFKKIGDVKAQKPVAKN